MDHSPLYHWLDSELGAKKYNSSRQSHEECMFAIRRVGGEVLVVKIQNSFLDFKSKILVEHNGVIVSRDVKLKRTKSLKSKTGEERIQSWISGFVPRLCRRDLYQMNLTGYFFGQFL